MRTLVTLTLFLAVSSTASVALPEEEIDRLLADHLVDVGLESAPHLDDHAFARRAYLSVIGRIPSPKELEAFLANPDRATLTDALFDHPGRISHDYNFWADLLRLKARIPGVPGTSTRAYANWLRATIAANHPYDEMVRALITADGYSGDNGATGFYLRDRGMPLDHLANTAQTFLGTRLVCAQCHDHPFESWTQLEFYELAAFSSPVKVTSLPAGFSERLPEVLEHMTRRERTIKTQSFGPVTRAFRNAVVEETAVPLKLPHDYQYEDAAPHDIVLPRTPFGTEVAIDAGESRTAAYAEWMTSPENPRFTRLIANRLWKRTFGLGLFEPIDDVDSARNHGPEELLDHLARLLISLDYDLIAFRKILCRTDLFSRQAIAFSPDSNTRFGFSGPRHRRLSAEQIWDSIALLRRNDIDETIQLRREAPSDALERNAWRQVRDSTPLDLLQQSRAITRHLEESEAETISWRQEIDDLDASEGDAAAAWLERLIAENERDLARYASLTWIGEGPDPAKIIPTPFHNLRMAMVRVATNKFPNIRPRYVDYFFRSSPVQSPEQEYNSKKEAIQVEYQRLLESTNRRTADQYRFQANLELRARSVLRASEVGNPSPETHFLRELGQSDRELIDNSRRDASIPQLLALRNGAMVDGLRNSATSLWRNLPAEATPEKLLDSLFAQMLTRPPNKAESSALLSEFEKGRDHGIRTTIWVLLNTSEFVFPP